MRVLVTILFSAFTFFLGLSQEKQSIINWDGKETLDYYPCFVDHASAYITKKEIRAVKNKVNLFRERDSTQVFIDMFANATVTTFGYCNKGKIDRRILNDLDETKSPQYLKNVFIQFCSCTYDENTNSYNPRKMIDSYIWLRKEYFCMWSRGQSDLLGLRIEPYKKHGMRLNEVSIKTCDQLREDEIILDDAYYRFGQELEIMDKSLGKDYAGYLINNIVKLDFSKLFK